MSKEEVSPKTFAELPRHPRVGEMVQVVRRWATADHFPYVLEENTSNQYVGERGRVMGPMQSTGGTGWLVRLMDAAEGETAPPTTQTDVWEAVERDAAKIRAIVFLLSEIAPINQWQDVIVAADDLTNQVN